MEENEPEITPEAQAVATEPAHRRPLYIRIGRITIYTALTMGVASLLWVLAYRFVMPPATFLTLRDQTEGLDVQRQQVRLADISPHLSHAIIASEDQAFCIHNGFDWVAIAKAQEYNARSSRTRGASTVSMQTAKNAFLWPSRTWIRKGVEVYYTLLIESFWPKHRILEVYLNIVEWGPGIFGAEAAARYHFGKSAAQLTAYESALLAAALPSPLRSRPGRPTTYLTGRAQEILSTMDKIDVSCSQQ